MSWTETIPGCGCCREKICGSYTIGIYCYDRDGHFSPQGWVEIKPYNQYGFPFGYTERAPQYLDTLPTTVDRDHNPITVTTTSDLRISLDSGIYATIPEGTTVTLLYRGLDMDPQYVTEFVPICED